jgi:hypothetical protein
LSHDEKSGKIRLMGDAPGRKTDKIRRIATGNPADSRAERERSDVNYKLQRH